MAHHKRKRPKHRRSGCLLCKPQKLTANVKAERRASQRVWVENERAAWRDMPMADRDGAAQIVQNGRSW